MVVVVIDVVVINVVVVVDGRGGGYCSGRLGGR